MTDTTPLQSKSTADEGGRDYVRFIILCAPRTGSNMLASSLNSSANIVCFRELFNIAADFIGFGVGGYDRFSEADRKLRDTDFERFLRERIFCRHADDIHAVGFKMPYPHFLGFPGLREWLVAQSDIRVLHLRRRNLLRSLVSQRIARMTGGWMQGRQPSLLSKLTLRNATKAARSPVKAASALRRLMRPSDQEWKARRRPVALTQDECRSYFGGVESQAQFHDELFHEHKKHTVYYEDLLSDQTDALNRVQMFLGVEPAALSPATGRQNPEPLRELIEDYEELRDAFRGTPQEEYFD